MPRFDLDNVHVQTMVFCQSFDKQHLISFWVLPSDVSTLPWPDTVVGLEYTLIDNHVVVFRVAEARSMVAASSKEASNGQKKIFEADHSFM